MEPSSQKSGFEVDEELTQFCGLQEHDVARFGAFHTRLGPVVSLLLHAVGILLLVLLATHTPRFQQHSTIAVEVVGAVTNRQLREMHISGPPQPRAGGPAAPNQKAFASREVSRKTEEPVEIKMAAVEHADPPALPLPVEELRNKQASAGSSSLGLPGSSGGGDVTREQSQETVAVRKESEADRIQTYVATVVRKINENLIYPREVRKKGIQGETLIAFTVTRSGDIKEGSLHVQKSSGFSGLDASALQAARGSSPFDPPPRELEIAVGVAFEVGR